MIGSYSRLSAAAGEKGLMFKRKGLMFGCKKLLFGHKRLMFSHKRQLFGRAFLLILTGSFSSSKPKPRNKTLLYQSFISMLGRVPIILLKVFVK